VTEALVPLWEVSDRLCGKRLQALLPLLLALDRGEGGPPPFPWALKRITQWRSKGR